MGFFSKVRKVFNPGGAVVSKIVNDGRDYQGVLDYAMNGQKQAQKNQDAQKQAQKDQYASLVKPAYSPAPNGQTSYPALRLGWTNGGYNYANSPFNGMAPTQAPPQPMSFAPAQGTMTASGPQQMLPPAPNGGSMPGAGAQPMPTGPRISDPRVNMIRNGGLGRMIE